MSHPNRRQRRNRTFRVEVLESRQLLSAVGAPAHHVAEVAPLVRPDPKTITGTIHGTLQKFSPGPGVATATFACRGDLKHFSNASLFVGNVEYLVTMNGKDITYTSSGSPALVDENSNGADKILVDFAGHGKVTSKSKSEATFTWNGSVVGGAGIYSGVAPGTEFHAHGDLFGNTFKIKATLKVHITGA
jgi:hypothetical protein